ncbi:Snf7 [Metarhizium brunneum]
MGDLAGVLAEHDQNFRKARLPALYSDFRPQRTLNPDGYRANIVAWQGALSCLLLRGLLSGRGPNSSLLVLNVDENLPHDLESNRFGQPLALGTAIRQAIAHQKFISVEEFLQPQAATFTRNLISLSWNAAEWTFRQFGIKDKISNDDSVPIGQYVIMNNVETVFQEFKQQVSGSTSHFDRIFTRLQFQSLFASTLVAGQCLSEDDLEVLLTFSSRDKGFIDYSDGIIRIRSSSDESGIGPEDVAVASIKELTANLRHQTLALNMRIDSLTREIKTALGKNNRVVAQASLKSRKLAESSLAKRYATLNQLEDIAAKLEQASDQVQLVAVMKSSANALHSLNTRIGGSDRVDQVMEQIREQMLEVDEVAAILAEPTGETIDESEIQDELEALETETREAARLAKEKEEAEHEAGKIEELQNELANLPNVPTEIPSESDKSNTRPIEKQVASLSLDHS